MRYSISMRCIDAQFDADGNMLTDGRFRYTWNAENRLVLAQELCAPSNRFPYTVSYAYDHRGRMVSKRITENDGQDTLVSSTTYLWDNWNIIRETQGLGVRGQGAGGPWLLVESESENLF